jgi:hypothetical protein
MWSLSRTCTAINGHFGFEPDFSQIQTVDEVAMHIEGARFPFSAPSYVLA